MPVNRQMLKIFSFLIFIILGSAALLTPRVMTREAVAGASTEQIEFFEKKIRPVLMRNCAACHNPDAKIAGLDLTTAEGFWRGGESGTLVDRQNPESSRLLKVVGYQEKLKMPPTGKLREDELVDLAAWVKMGAPWPASKLSSTPNVAETKVVNEVKSSTREFTPDERAYWAFQPVRSVNPPVVTDNNWVRTPVDAFILHKLEEKKLSPAPEADKHALLRRATLDLTGLPPTEAEMREFLADGSPGAFAKVVDRLLASPRYGEKWGRNWLDVARYADSTGNDEDHRYPNAWRYRDYVISSFNNDLPYDQFVREQLAGDLMPAKRPGEVNRQGITATGFLALGPKAIAQQDKKKMLYDVYDEQLDVTTRAFMGLTVACSRCHNHKFDPILTRDYYSIVGIFAGTRSFSDPMAFVSESLNKPLVTKSEFDAWLAAKKVHQEKVKTRQLEIGVIVDAAKERMAVGQTDRLAEYMLAARSVHIDKSDSKSLAEQQGLDPAIFEKWVKYLNPDNIKQHLLVWQNSEAASINQVADDYQKRFLAQLSKWNETLSAWRVKYRQALKNGTELPNKPDFDGGKDRFFDEIYFGKGPFSVTQEDKHRFTADESKRIESLKAELEKLKKEAPPEPEMACAVEDGDIIEQKVFIRGDYHNEGEDAPKAAPAILAEKTGALPEVKTGSGRLELAQWLTRPDHPLTARVVVNRIWQWHFGDGIVRTPDNFGKMGERPTHPELLDYLARRFIESGWSIKSMHRLIMLSSAYRMSSEVSAQALAADQENKLLTRFNRRRLSVEEMRDGVLALSGDLDLTMGGTLQEGTGTDGENDNKRLSLNPELLRRRTVYLPLRRANLPTLLNLFDFGDATAPSGKRQLTNVATQALFWMNSEFLTEATKKIARALLQEKHTDDAARIQSAYLRLLGRQAGQEELKTGLGFLEDFRRKYPIEEPAHAAWQSLCRILLASNDFVYVD